MRLLGVFLDVVISQLQSLSSMEHLLLGAKFQGCAETVKNFGFRFFKNRNEPTLNIKNRKLGFRGTIFKKPNRQFLDGFFHFSISQKLEVACCMAYLVSKHFARRLVEPLYSTGSSLRLSQSMNQSKILSTFIMPNESEAHNGRCYVKSELCSSLLQS